MRYRVLVSVASTAGLLFFAAATPAYAATPDAGASVDTVTTQTAVSGLDTSPDTPGVESSRGRTRGL